LKKYGTKENILSSGKYPHLQKNDTSSGKQISNNKTSTNINRVANDNVESIRTDECQIPRTREGVDDVESNRNSYENQNTSQQQEIYNNSEEQETDIVKPKYIYPWEPLLYILDSRMTAYYTAMGLQFAAMFTSLTLLLPFRLTASPYNLDAAIVGVAYLPVGVGMLIGAVCGGMMSDMSAKKYSKTYDGIVAYPLIFSYLNSIGCLGYGYTLHYSVHIAGPLIFHFLIGIGQSVLMPALMGFFSSYKQQNAAAANSVGMFLCFGLAALWISFSIPLANTVGFQNLFWIFFGLSFLTSLWASVVCYRNITLSLK